MRPIRSNDVLGGLSDERQARADAVRGIVHRRQPGPVIWPAGHVLLMGAAEELELPSLPGVELIHEEKLTGIDDGLHHHVFLARFLLASTICLHSSTRGHRHRAGHVLARLERGDGLRGVSGIGELMCTASTFGSASTSLNPVTRPRRRDRRCFQHLPGATADRVEMRIGVALIDRHEFRAESQTDNRDSHPSVSGHRDGSSRRVLPELTASTRLVCIASRGVSVSIGRAGVQDDRALIRMCQFPQATVKLFNSFVSLAATMRTIVHLHAPLYSADTSARSNHAFTPSAAPSPWFGSFQKPRPGT